MRGLFIFTLIMLSIAVVLDILALNGIQTERFESIAINFKFDVFSLCNRLTEMSEFTSPNSGGVTSFYFLSDLIST